MGFGLKYPTETGWTNYYFAKNLQGDVTAIYRSDASGGSYTGTLVAKYAYDPYGQILSVTSATGTAISPTAANVANYNPFRYRGYYYDTESGFYYLQSRYYDPEICRFINADNYASTGQGFLGCNMFAYCNNNPVMQADPSGEDPGFNVLRQKTDAGSGGGVGGAGLVVGLGILIYTGVKSAVNAVTKTAALLANTIDEQLQNIAEFSSAAAQGSRVRSRTVSASITKAVDKAKAKVASSNRFDYWLAVYVDFGEGRGTYLPTVGLSYAKAIVVVRGGGDVFASSKQNARRLALAVGYGISPERDNPHHDRVTGSSIGYWPHYHDGRRRGGHIFYATY